MAVNFGQFLNRCIKNENLSIIFSTGGNMDRSNSKQKKNIIMSYVYAGIVALLVIVGAITIAVITANKTTVPSDGPMSEVGGNNAEVDVPVSIPTYVVPMKNATVSKDYSGKELQYNDTLKQWEIHKAIDFLAGEEVNVYALTDGTVSNVYNNYLEGTVIEISHGKGLVSVYKSLSKADVKVGDKVSTGQIVGQVGETMAAELNMGAHLHFEVLLDGVRVDPNNYIDLGDK